MGLALTIVPQLRRASRILSYEALFLKPTTNASAVPNNAISNYGIANLVNPHWAYKNV